MEINKKSPVSKRRWEIAQESEKEYWQHFTKESLLKEEAGRHRKKAKLLIEEYKKFININKNTKILQIGSGPEDIINYFKVGKRFAIDPLAEFYKKKFKLNYDSITFLQGRAEKLPFNKKSFDIVILANVLDHVENPENALLEVHRILKPNGIFHFENLFYQKRFILVAKIWGTFKEFFTKTIFNIHHPFMFTLPDLKKLIKKDYEIFQEHVGKEIGVYENISELIKQKKKEGFKSKFLTLFRLYGTINYTSFCKKKSS